ncbi:DNA-binding protein [Domibacillus epiphyticus]|uniref:DNA-binding protein n=1 Tax=Domibacillus epiphyticus TaxID=1714355 RepID=UPI001E3F2987|nr:DNA-binding protein [Domibacillus epiphyticus]
MAGYFIGDGLKNFKHPSDKSLLDYFKKNDHRELIKESDVHHVLGIAKEDARKLVHEYPDIPHLTLNGRVYFPKTKLRQWLKK